MMMTISSAVKKKQNRKAGTFGKSRFITAPMLWMSAPIFNTTAGIQNTTIVYRMNLG